VKPSTCSEKLCAAILPAQGLTKTLAHWSVIAKGLVETKRKRNRHLYEVNAYGAMPQTPGI